MQIKKIFFDLSNVKKSKKNFKIMFEKHLGNVKFFCTNWSFLPFLTAITSIRAHYYNFPLNLALVEVRFS